MLVERVHSNKVNVVLFSNRTRGTGLDHTIDVPIVGYHPYSPSITLSSLDLTN